MEQTRRQAFAVTSRLQYRFLTMTLIYCFILISLVMVAFLVPDVLEMNNSNLNPEIRAAAAERLLEKHGWAWPPVVPLLALIGLISFREFKKVAGPLYRFRWAFEQLEKGNLLSSVKIRKKDYLIDEEAAINRMLASLVGKYSVIKRESDAALETIAELEGSLNQDGTLNQTQIELLRSHSRHLEDLSSAVGYFRLQDAPQESTVSMQDVGIDDARDIKEEGNEPFGLARG